MERKSGRKSSGRIVRCGALLIALAAPAWGADFEVGDGQTVGGQTLTDPGDRGVVRDGGTISVGAGTAVQMNADDQTLVNRGTITTGNGSGVQAIGDGIELRGSGDYVVGSGSAIQVIGDDADLRGGGDVTVGTGSAIQVIGNDAGIQRGGDVTVGSGSGVQIIGEDGKVEQHGDFTVGTGSGIQIIGEDGKVEQHGDFTLGSGSGIQVLGNDGKVEQHGDFTVGSGSGIQIIGEDGRVEQHGDFTLGSGSGIQVLGNDGKVEQHGDFTVGTGSGIQIIGEDGKVEQHGDFTLGSGSGIQVLGNDGKVEQRGDFTLGSGSGIQVLGNDGRVEQHGDLTLGSGTGIQLGGNDGSIEHAGGDIVIGSGTAVMLLGSDGRIDNRGDTTVGTGGAFFASGERSRIVNRGDITVGSGTAAQFVGSDGRIDNHGDTTVGSGTGLMVTGERGRIANRGDTTVGSGTGLMVVGSDGRIDNRGDTTIGSGTGLMVSGERGRIANRGDVSIGTGTGLMVVGNDARLWQRGSVSVGVGTAILMNGLNSWLHLDAGSEVLGDILFTSPGDSTLSLGRGYQGVLSITGMPANFEFGGMPYVVAGSQVGVVEPTAFAATDEILTDLTSAVAGAVEDHLAGLRRCARNESRSAQDPEAKSERCGPGGWVSAIGSYRDQEGGSDNVGFEHGLYGAVAGADFFARDDQRAGFFAGVGAGELDSHHGAASGDDRNLFGGFYWSRANERHFVDVSLHGGVSEFERRRRVLNNLFAGADHTSVEYLGGFLSPSIHAGMPFRVSQATLVPSLRLRYAGLLTESYDEDGPDGALDVDERATHVVETRAQLAFEYDPFVLPCGTWDNRVYLGIEGVFHWGERVDAELLGSDLSFEADSEDPVARGLIGLESVFTLTNGLQAEAGIDLGRGTDDAFTLRGNLGLRLSF